MISIKYEINEREIGMILEVDNVTKIYKNNRGASGISFKIDKGQIFGLLGPNGSGKTTIMKCITGLISPREGSINIEGYNIKTEPEKALSSVGSIIETPTFISYMSAYDNLKTMSGFYENPMSPDEALDIVGLTKYKKDKVARFSLGMKQRMGIALAIIGYPKLLILDEPTNGMDIEGTVEIRNLIIHLAKETGASVLISSHQAAELQQMCTHVGIMKESSLIGVEAMDVVLEENASLEKYYLHKVSEAFA